MQPLYRVGVIKNHINALFFYYLLIVCSFVGLVRQEYKQIIVENSIYNM